MMTLLAALMFCTTNSTGLVTQWSPGNFVGSNCQIEKTNIVMATVPNPSYIAYWRTLQAVWSVGMVAPFDVNAVSDALDAQIKSTTGAEQIGWSVNAKNFAQGIVQLGQNYDWTQTPPATLPAQ